MKSLFRRSVKFGGIRPATHKQSSLRSRIMPTPLPPVLRLSLQQHRGVASTPCVEVGESVLRYQPIAVNAATGLPLHAPASGIITSMDSEILLRCDEQQKELELSPSPNYLALELLELIAKLKAAGLSDPGGTGIPTAMKLRRAIEEGVDTLIINGLESEPHVSCDEALMRERAADVIQGTEILQACCLAKRCVIAVGSNQPDALAALRANLKSADIKLKIITSRYPAGDARQLVHAVTGRETSQSQSPIDSGAVVINVGTAAAAYEAIMLGKPCTSRITTLTGSCLRTPKNFEVPIGTPVAHLLKLCGIDSGTHQQTILGGSLRGQPIDAETASIGMDSQCLIAAAGDEFPDPGETLPCIRCGFCADACPSHLLPQQLLHFAKTNDFVSLHEHGINDCTECGGCAYVCPSKIPLVDFFHASKAAIEHQFQERELGDHWQQRFNQAQARSRQDAGQAASTAADGQDKPSETGQAISREQAQEEIAAAVKRAKQKKTESKT